MTNDWRQGIGRRDGGGVGAGVVVGLSVLALVVVAVALLAFGGLFAGGGAVIDGGVGGGFDGDLRGEMSSTLKNAATAQESFRTVNPRYTRSQADLRGEGFVPGRPNLVIVHATGKRYCMEARAAGHVMHYDSTVGMPLEGAC